MTRQRQLLLVLVAAVVVLAGVIVVVLGKTGDSDGSGGGGIASDRKLDIDAGGITIAAEVITPRGVDKPALIVMPASWGQPATQYQAIGRELAGDGFLVVAYAQRGFEGSGGVIDPAGSGTQGDVSRVIDWALRNTDADAKRVGAYGLSYGAGVSLLAAAKDPRIKAVAALSTWTDLAASYDPGNTPSTRALATLIGRGGAKNIREGADVRSLRSLLAKDPAKVGARMRQLSPTRSPATYVDQLNRNKTAIMLANGYADSLFGPQQLVDFYDELTAPKRLQLAPGDHGGPEASALRGARNPVATAASAWLDHYLRGADNGIDDEDPIVLTDGNTDAVHTLRRWPAAATDDLLPLGQPNSKAQSGSRRATSWTATIAAGADTVAGSGVAVAPFGSYQPPEAQLLTIASELAFVWTGPAATQPTTVAGTPRVTVNLASNKRSATVVAYLYDINALGLGRLMSVQPYSMTGLTPTRARRVSIDLQPIAWTLPVGDRLVVVLDTVDQRYTTLNPTGARITASATKTSPATFSIPALAGAR